MDRAMSITYKQLRMLVGEAQVGQKIENYVYA